MIEIILPEMIKRNIGIVVNVSSITVLFYKQILNKYNQKKKNNNNIKINLLFIYFNN